MTDLPLSLEDMKAIVGIVGVIVSVLFGIFKITNRLLSRLSDQIEKTREESARGRQRVHQRLDEMREHLDANFVRRDVYAADQRAVQHALAEANQIATLAVQGRERAVQEN